jgi:hypothetical protein
MVSINSITSIIVLATITLAQSLATPHPHNAQLKVYPRPTEMPTKGSFSVMVRSPKTEWVPLDIYLAKLSLINTTSGSGQIQESSMAYFDFSGTVDVEVTYNPSAVHSADIRPNSYGIIPKVRGNTLKFSLVQPRNLVIQVNDEIFDCLQLFAGSIETNVPAANDTDVIYFGPGMHSVSGGVLQVPSGKTVYIAGGGVLTSGVNFTNVHDATLRGRGILYNTPGGAITVAYSERILISGVTVLNPNGYAVTAGQANQLTIEDFHAFSSKGNGDGIDLFSCSDTLIDNIFMRNSDDCVAIYNHRWDYYGNSSNITLQNSSLWADVAHPINIGTHGNTDSPETMDGIAIKNIDILDHREPQMLYQGCIAINPGDSNLVQNVLIEDVRVEDFREGQLINMRVMFNSKYNTSPGRGIRNVTIRNLTYEGTKANPSIFEGYSEEKSIDGVTFENLVVNGKVIADAMQKPTWYLASDFVPMYANDHTKNLFFNRTL